MKLSVSISDDVAQELERIAKLLAGSNASLITDVALKQLLSLPQGDLVKLVSRHRLDRKATTRNGWAGAFWQVLGQEMGRDDRIANPMAARNYGDFCIVMLMNHMNGVDDEADPFPIRLWPAMSTPESPLPVQWVFERSRSPVRAAEEVAVKLRELGAVRAGGSPKPAFVP